MIRILPCIALLVGCQFGGSGMPMLADDMPQTFLALDEDRDGSISRAEASAAPVLDRRFLQADADGSGALDRYEFNTPGWRPFPHEPD